MAEVKELTDEERLEVAANLFRGHIWEVQNRLPSVPKAIFWWQTSPDYDATAEWRSEERDCTLDVWFAKRKGYWHDYHIKTGESTEQWLELDMAYPSGWKAELGRLLGAAFGGESV